MQCTGKTVWLVSRSQFNTQSLKGEKLWQPRILTRVHLHHIMEGGSSAKPHTLAIFTEGFCLATFVIQG